MEKSMQKIILIIVGLMVVGGAYYLSSRGSDEGLFKDDVNQVSFKKPAGWMASSIDGYARAAANTEDAKAPSVLIKIDYPESIIPSLGLDVAEEVVVGGKSVRRVDHEWETKDASGEVTGKQTFTFLMWTAPSGKQIIFEITPWQKPSVSPEVEEIVRSFAPNR